MLNKFHSVRRDLEFSSPDFDVPEMAVVLTLLTD